MQQLIDLYNEENCATVFGYVCDVSDEYWRNYIQMHLEEKTANLYIEKIASLPINKVSVLRNMHVDADERNRGYGNNMLTWFLEESAHSKVVLLFADTLETNDFDIVSWYQKFDFEILHKSNSGTLMLFSTI